MISVKGLVVCVLSEVCMSKWCEADGKVVGVRLPDEVIESIESRARAEDLSVGLWIKKLLIDMFSVDCESNLEGSYQS